MTTSQADPRKTVCRALTNVLRKSDLGQDIDPKAFYMLLKTNFEALYRPEGLDLTPLWGSLSAQVGQDDLRLPGLFVAFEQRSAQLGLTVKLPLAVGDLTFEQKSLALSRSFSYSEEEAVVEAASEDIGFDTKELPPLDRSLLKPIIAEETRRELIRVVVQTLKNSPAGSRFDGAQMAYAVDQHFDQLLADGRHFDVGPILKSLKNGEQPVSDADVYVGLWRMRQKLQELDIELVVPPLEVSEEDGERLVAEAVATERAERASVLRAPPPAPRTPPSRAATPTGQAPPSSSAETKKERELRRYGLRGVGERRWRAIRRLALTLTLAGAGVSAWMLRPDRPLDAARYPVPLRQAELVSGTFVGVLDEKAWYEIPLERRPTRVTQMSSQLAQDGLSAQAVIKDRLGRHVMRSFGNGQLKSSRFALESSDGVTPPPRGKFRDPNEMARESLASE